MQNEKQNKHIQQTVGELRQLPDGFTFNNQKVWVGLEQRLPGRQQKKAGWYYAAASVLLIVGATCFVLFNNAKQVVNTKPVANAVIESTKKMAPLPGSQEARLRARIPSRRIKQTIQASATSLPEQTEMAETSIQQPQPVASPVEQVAAIVLPAEKTNKVEKKTTTVVVTKPSPKYKIVHLNELDQSPQPVNNTLTRSELKRNSQQHTEEKEIAAPVENSRQLLYFKIKPVTTTTSIVEN